MDKRGDHEGCPYQTRVAPTKQVRSVAASLVDALFAETISKRLPIISNSSDY